VPGGRISVRGRDHGQAAAGGPAGGGCGSASAGQAASADAERRADGGKARNGKATRMPRFFSRLGDALKTELFICPHW